MAIHPIGLCGEGITTAVAGSPVLMRGERIELGGGPKLRVSVPLMILLAASGVATSTATVQVEMSGANQTATDTHVATDNGTTVTVVAPGGQVTASITTFVTGDVLQLYFQNAAGTWALVPDANFTIGGVANSTGFAATMTPQVVSCPGALAYRWEVTTSSGAGGSITVLSDWVIQGSAWSVTIPTGGAPQINGTAPMMYRLHSMYDYVRVNVPAVSGVTVQGWVKRLD